MLNIDNKIDVNELIGSLTLEEKIPLLALVNDVYTRGIEKMGIHQKAMLDGPHGLRLSLEKNCTHFPNLCSLAATWDIKMAELMGDALANDCIEHDIDLVFGPGMNIKRTPLCGRNFEYFSEDPIVAGEMASGYVNGLQKKGIGACIKHFAVNNQEKYRCVTSVEIDERTLREIYLKGFEITVKKAKPYGIMCAYNKVNAIWCSENKHLLTDILKNEWGYEGFVISDYGAVHDPVRALAAGLDLHMPEGSNFTEKIKVGLKENKIKEEQIDMALRHLLRFLTIRKPEKAIYNRDSQHEIAVKIAEAGIVLLKNEDNVLPLTKEKYKKIAVIGEFAENPLVSGQGSAEVHQSKNNTDSAIDKLKKLLPEVEIEYREMFKKSAFSENMLWAEIYKPGYREFISSADVVIVFAGDMSSENTEKLDRRTIEINPNYEMFIEFASMLNKNVVVVLQNGGAVIIPEWRNQAKGIVEMWLAGEAAGSAIANVLCGKVNPSGKLPETFPKRLRTDIDYPGNGRYVEYNEKLEVGYRYYDKHPEEICYPFGFGLSYTEFSYDDISVIENKDTYEIRFKLKNIGDRAGEEVVQAYLSDSISNVKKTEKELKQFKKVYLEAGEEKEVSFTFTQDDFSYYNVMLGQWVVENGLYKILIGSSSRDIMLIAEINYNKDMIYSIKNTGTDMMSDTSDESLMCFGE